MMQSTLAGVGRVGRKIASGVTAGRSAVAATNIPVVSQVAGVASLGAALIRDLF